ncbi:MAG: hypothetical protein KIT22_14920, partial [Verrucomicrobiae bacterium]|nr:hypothetical protein [Verrucomicrobiae bacterium]
MNILSACPLATPGRLKAGLRTLHKICLGLLFIAISQTVAPAAEVLIRELISREYTVHVGGVQTPEIKEIVSREVGLMVENGFPGVIHEVISREVGLANTTPEPPPPVTGVILTPSPRGDRVDVDWRNYNQWAVGDIVRFDIYRSNLAFTNVAGMTPIRSLPAETTGTVFFDLPEWQDHFFAIVAVDGLGNADPGVQFFGAYIVSREVVSREVGLFVGAEPEPPYRESVSREVSLLLSTPEPPPPVAGLQTTHTPRGDSATLDWQSYNQWAVGDVARYDIYFSNRPFTSVAGMTRYATAPGETTSITFQGLPDWQDHFFAVVPVDGLGNYESEVAYAGVYIISQEVISREVGLFVGAEQAPPYREVVSREVSLVVPTAEAPAPVTGVDSGFTVSTSLARPRALEVDWTAYNEPAQQDVSRYRVYLGTSFFEDVTNLMPHALLNDGRQRVTLDGLESATIYYVAVVAEDSLGQFNPTVRSASGITTPRLEMSIPDQTVNEGAPLAYQLEVTERDLTGYDLAFGLVSGPPGIAVNRNGSLTWTPEEAQGPGVYAVLVRVVDNGIPPVTATTEFIIMVLEVNVAPVLAAMPDQEVPAGGSLNLTLTATDVDLPEQRLVFSRVTGPAGLSVSPEGLVTWTPDASQSPSTNSVVVQVSDGIASQEGAFTVRVAAPEAGEFAIGIGAFNPDTGQLEL